MRHRDRGLADVQQAVLRRFRAEGLHALFVLYSEKADLFGVRVFFDDEAALDAARGSGVADQIERAVADELVRAGRGARSTLNLKFEFDTDQNVRAAFGGDYYSRLR